MMENLLNSVGKYIMRNYFLHLRLFVYIFLLCLLLLNLEGFIVVHISHKLIAYNEIRNILKCKSVKDTQNIFDLKIYLPNQEIQLFMFTNIQQSWQRSCCSWQADNALINISPFRKHKVKTVACLLLFFSVDLSGITFQLTP